MTCFLTCVGFLNSISLFVMILFCIEFECFTFTYLTFVWLPGTWLIVNAHSIFIVLTKVLTSLVEEIFIENTTNYVIIRNYESRNVNDSSDVNLRIATGTMWPIFFLIKNKWRYQNKKGLWKISNSTSRR